MRAVPVVFALFYSNLALAQNKQDLEYRETTVETEAKGELEVRSSFETQYFEYNNLDFRPLDEQDDQAILDSDDRSAFAFTGVSLELGYQVDEQIRFVFGASHRGLWGNDQFGGTNAFGGWMYFNAAYADLTTSKSGFSDGVHFRVGRQFYRMGGLGGGRDYVLADVLDMVRVDIPLGDIGSVTLIPINVMSTASTNDGANFVSYIGSSAPETFNFNGDTLSRRYGATVNIAPDEKPYEAVAYGFYSDLGAAGTGSDISYDGLLGNFSDNDWIANFGVRGNVEIGPATIYAHFDGSTGIDRKELVAQDVDTSGIAFGGGVRADTSSDDSRAGFKGELSYFDSYGAAFGKDGLMYSHGYVGMKAQQVGGTLFNRMLGYHPTAYASLFGVSDSPNEQSRKAGTRAIHARAGYELENGFRFSAAWWMLMDTSISSLNLSELDKITPPFGYAREEFAAQERVGKGLGQELNLDLGYAAGEHVDVFANGAIILPGAYQSVPVARVAGSMLGSENPAMPWALYAGTRVRF